MKVTRLGISRDWLMAEIPASARDDLIERLALERAPLDSDEFWFAGADFRERRFVAVFDSGSAIAFGLSASDESPRMLVGCNFLSFSYSAAEDPADCEYGATFLQRSPPC